MSKKDPKKQSEKTSSERELNKLFHDVTLRMNAIVQSELSLTKAQLTDVTNKTLTNLGYQVPAATHVGRKG